MARSTSVVIQEEALRQLADCLSAKTARIGVIGLGYVGLPLAVAFARAGFSVMGLDVAGERVVQVNEGRSYIPDIPDATLALLARGGRLRATCDYAILSDLDVIVICVPTPLRKTREPDISYILSATQEIALLLRPGQLVVLESTTYPGTTEEVILPLLESGGFRVGRDFCLAFSPERIDPGNRQYLPGSIPKVVGGITSTCQRLALQLYQPIVPQLVPVSSTKVAEMVKLLENTFRTVNIGLVNEIALLCHTLGLDIWEVIEAAKTKPFGFMAFYPGPGIGGHCIPSDPIYLAWKARAHGFEPRFIEVAEQVNRRMPQHVVETIAAALNERRKPLKGSRILLIGLAYKKDVSDTRDSPAFEVASTLSGRGAEVAYHDPHVPSTLLNGAAVASQPLRPEGLRDTDCVVILANHSVVDYELILHQAPLIVDMRNQYAQVRHSAPHVVTF